MRAIALSALAGLACGIIGTMAFNHFRASQAQAESPDLQETAGPEEIRTLRTQLKFSEEQVTRLQAAQTALTAQVNEAKRQPAPAAPKNRMTPAFESIVKSQMKEQGQSKLLAMKTRLRLSPDQEARLKAYFDDQAKLTEELAARMMSGEKVDPKAVAAERKGAQTEDQVLDAVLNPAQKTEYKKMKEEERAGQVEISANFELSQMTPLLNLNEQQKDQFFQAVASAEQEMQTPEGRKKFLAPGSPEDPTRFLEARDKAKLAAVKAILTPEQWEIYRTRLESRTAQQREMMKAFLPAK